MFYRQVCACVFVHTHTIFENKFLVKIEFKKNFMSIHGV